ELVGYADRHEGEPFVMIGIDADEKRDKVQEFVNHHRVRFPVVIDQGGKLQKLFGVRGFPTTVFIGTDGIVHIYQIGPVANAEVAFDSFYRQAQELLKSGKGIAPEVYRKLLAEQEAKKTPEQGEKEEEKEPQLTGRAKTIAEKMGCPCGCEHTVAGCGCKTAKDIKEALARRDLAGKSDAQVIKELNKEFCVKDDNC
ncbi:MAG TPA: redoxin domain-containing protein, partial [Candidatus Methylomirabilis sp.]|nr:redoxin domain-containing protein [Candidatus Methylomirabilis sp.]